MVWRKVRGGVLEKREGVMEKKGWWGAGWPGGEGMVQPESKFVVKITLKVVKVVKCWTKNSMVPSLHRRQILSGVWKSDMALFQRWLLNLNNLRLGSLERQLETWITGETWITWITGESFWAFFSTDVDGKDIIDKKAHTMSLWELTKYIPKCPMIFHKPELCTLTMSLVLKYIGADDWLPILHTNLCCATQMWIFS